MTPAQQKAYFAKRQKIVNNYNNAHDTIEKLTKKKYSSISTPEYVRKVRHYHNTISKYQKEFGIKPNNVISMS